MAETDRKSYITKAGLDLYSKIQTGSTPLTITRVEVGDGTYSEQEILNGEMTALKSPVKIDASIEYIRATGNGEAILSIALSVSEKAFYLREIGVYATDPDVGEILYSYCSFGDTADYIESYNGLYSVFQRADIYIKIGNATDLRVDITDRAYATPEELRRAASVVTSTIYNNTAPNGNVIKITVPDMPADPYEQGNPDSLDNKMIAVSVGNYTATSDVANMKLSINDQITDLWKFPIGKKGDTGKVQSFKAYEIRPNSILLIGIKDHYGYIANTMSAAKSAEEISDSTDNNTDYVTPKQVTNYVLDKEKYAFGNVYPIDINQVGSGNNILYINVPGVKSYDELDGKAVALNTGIYCVQWDTPQTVYININGLGNKALYRPLPTNDSADYDTRQYNTDKYVKGEISRQQTLIVSFRKDSNVVTATLLNPAPAPRATKAIETDSADEVSYITPKIMAPFVKTLNDLLAEMKEVKDRLGGLGVVRVYNTNPEDTAVADLRDYTTYLPDESGEFEYKPSDYGYQLQFSVNPLSWQRGIGNVFKTDNQIVEVINPDYNDSEQYLIISFDFNKEDEPKISCRVSIDMSEYTQLPRYENGVLTIKGGYFDFNFTTGKWEKCSEPKINVGDIAIAISEESEGYSDTILGRLEKVESAMPYLINASDTVNFEVQGIKNAYKETYPDEFTETNNMIEKSRGEWINSEEYGSAEGKR